MKYGEIFVYAEESDYLYVPGAAVKIPLEYNVVPAHSLLAGLSLNIHYDSSILTPDPELESMGADIFSYSVSDDFDDLDGNEDTDKTLTVVWGDFAAEFPGVQLPSKIGDLQFSTVPLYKDSLTGEPLVTAVSLTSNEQPSGFGFIESSFNLQPVTFSLDVDNDRSVTALGDGLMIIRKLFGGAFFGEALTAKALSPNSPWSTEQVHDFIELGIDSGVLDVDRDGRTTALGDGLMVIRRLFGSAFAAEALISKAISPESPYYGEDNAWEMVAENIDALNPYL